MHESQEIKLTELMSQLKVNGYRCEILNFMAKNININFGIEMKKE